MKTLLIDFAFKKIECDLKFIDPFGVVMIDHKYITVKFWLITH